MTFVHILRVAYGVAAAVAVASVSAAPLDFGDCTSGTLKSLRHRIYGGKGDLLPVVFSRDVLHLTNCLGAGSSEARRIASRLESYSLEDHEISTSDGKSALAEAARDACGERRVCVSELYRRSTYKIADERIVFAGSGGLPFARFLGHLGKEGHYEITGAALANEGWSDVAIALMKDASRDADFLEWEHPAAHAQTANDDAAKVRDAGTAESSFVSWVRSYVERAQAECLAGRYRNASYLLGYSFHAAQDLAFHEGITNAEHSFRDRKQGVGIDSQERYQEKFDLAVQATKFVAKAFASRIGSHPCGRAMKLLAGPGKLTADEKLSLLRMERYDFTVLSYWRYHSLADVVETALAEGQSEPAFFIANRWLTAPRAASLERALSRLVP